MSEEIGQNEEQQAFLEHVAFTKFKLQGHVLCIGVNRNMQDLYPIIPHFQNIKSISLVSDEFDSNELTNNTERILEAYRKNHLKSCPDIGKIYSYTKFQDVNEKFDSAFFFGAPPQIIRYNHYESIPNILKPGGVFYGTFDTFGVLDYDWNLAGCSVTTTEQVKPHPIYRGSIWTGVTIKKVK